MARVEERPAGATHEVFNQSPPLENYNVFGADRPLVEAVEREGGGWATERIAELGAICGRPDTIRLGVEANENPPRLRTHDRFGHRVDEVEFHPAWHELMRIGIGHNTHALPWIHPRSGAHVARAASVFLLNQVDSGVCCPLAMTFAAPAALSDASALAGAW